MSSGSSIRGNSQVVKVGGIDGIYDEKGVFKPVVKQSVKNTDNITYDPRTGVWGGVGSSGTKTTTSDTDLTNEGPEDTQVQSYGTTDYGSTYSGSSGKSGAAPAASTSPPASTPPAPSKTPAGPTSGSTALSFNDKQMGMMLSKWGDKRGALENLSSSLIKKGVVGDKLRNTMMAFNNARDSYSTKAEDSSVIAPPETGIDSADKLIGWSEENRKEQEEFLFNQKKEQEALLKETRSMADATAAANAEIFEKRFAGVEENFQQVGSLLKDLEEKANGLLDMNVIQAVNARAKQLAAKGILTSEQAAGASGLMLTDYKANAELKRADIMKEINTAMITAQKEKQTAIDNIMGSQQLEEVRKLEMVDRINNSYNGILQGYANNRLSANQQINNQIASVVGQKIGLDVAIATAEAENALKNQISDEDKVRMEQDPEKKMDFVLEYMGGIDANMKREASIIMEQYIKDGRFASLPVLDLLAAVMKEAGERAKSYEQGGKSTSSGGSSSGAISTPSTVPTAVTPPAATTPTPPAADLTPEQILALTQENAAAATATTGVGQIPTQTSTNDSLFARLRTRAQNNPYTAAGAAVGTFASPVGTLIGGGIGAGIDYLTN